MAERVLIVEDEPNLRHMLGAILRREGYTVEEVETAEHALERYGDVAPDIVVTDLQMPGMGGMALVNRLQQRRSSATVIVMTAYGSTETALEAIKAGAYDYISKPFKPEEIVLTLRKAQERERLRQENRSLRKQIRSVRGADQIIFSSEAMSEVIATVGKVAPYKSTVLITGESGTGKELIARAVHHASDRETKPFVAVNCGAIAPNLLESELFGHAKGAFTDAVRERKGLIEEASGGTLFLDEIGELPSALQVKLLRVLQEEEIRRVGESKTRKVDVRVVAATARNLAEEIREGRFREDLFYRLNVMTIHLPPLRERPEDIPLLVDHFLERGSRRLDTTVAEVSPEAGEALRAYGWPGNVRELENVIERGLVMAQGARLEPEHLPDGLRRERPAPAATDTDLSLKRAVRELEESFIRRALQRTGGNRTRAAKVLEISPRALLYKLKEYGIR